MIIVRNIFLFFLLVSLVSAVSPPTESEAKDFDPSQSLPVVVQSESAILMDADTKEILFEKNARALQSPGSTTKVARKLPQTNFLMLPMSPYSYSNAIGVKTGHTEAGTALYVAANDQKRNLIAILLNAKDHATTFQDATALFEWGFNKDRHSSEVIPQSNAFIPQKSELIKMAKAVAATHNLPAALVCGIVQEESEWNCWAVRYEPYFHEHTIKPLLSSEQLGGTEEYSRACSWGLMQVMGQTARQEGFKGKFLSELCSPQIGLEIGCRFLAKKLEEANGDIDTALKRWNGTKNDNYPNAIKELMKKYE